MYWDTNPVLIALDVCIGVGKRGLVQSVCVLGGGGGHWPLNSKAALPYNIPL